LIEEKEYEIRKLFNIHIVSGKFYKKKTNGEHTLLLFELKNDENKVFLFDPTLDSNPTLVKVGKWYYTKTGDTICDYEKFLFEDNNNWCKVIGEILGIELMK
jgi:hypothetical protein